MRAAKNCMQKCVRNEKNCDLDISSSPLDERSACSIFKVSDFDVVQML